MPYFNHALFPVKIASNIDFPHLEGHLACDQFDSLQLRNLLEFGQTRNVRLVDLFFIIPVAMVKLPGSLYSLSHRRVSGDSFMIFSFAPR